jgi:quercetin dioxygenase-like cupin family protein
LEVVEELHLTSHETLRVLRDTPDELEVEATWDPGGAVPPPHLHPSQDEEFEIKEGELTAVVDGTERRLGPGDTLLIARGTPHKMWNQGSETAKASWRTRPALRTADWFRTVDRLTAGGTRKPALPAMAKAVTTHNDVFRLVVRPRPARPLVYVVLRLIALAAPRD